jgi:hypothetical protein
MLTVTPKAGIVEKIIRNRNGGFVRACFLVAEFEGKIFWKLIKLEPISGEVRPLPIRGGLTSANPPNYFLPIYRSRNFLPTASCQLQSILSPYIFKTFFISQLIRAPSKF